MTPRDASARLPRTAAVAEAIAKYLEIGAKKPRRVYRRSKEDSRQMPSNHLTSPK